MFHLAGLTSVTWDGRCLTTGNFIYVYIFFSITYYFRFFVSLFIRSCPSQYKNHSVVSEFCVFTVCVHMSCLCNIVVWYIVT